MARNSKKIVGTSLEALAALAPTVDETQNMDALIASIDTTVLDVPETPDVITAEEADAMARFAEGDEAAIDAIADFLEAKEDALESQVSSAQVTDEDQTGEASSEDQASEGDQAPTGEDENDDAVVKTFTEIVNEQTTEMREEMRGSIATALDEREAYELGEKSNDKIIKSLKSSRAKLVSSAIAGVFLATNVDPLILNRHRVSTNRYNVYAIDKLADLMRSLNSGDMMSIAINRACCKSLFKMRAAGIPFTMDMARAACSDKIRLSDAIARHLVRHTVAANTAPTQASSTMQALETLGIVKNVGTTRSAVYELTNTPQTKRLQEIVQKAA